MAKGNSVGGRQGRRVSGMAEAARVDATPYDVERIRQDFPILSRRIHGKPLAFLDSDHLG